MNICTGYSHETVFICSVGEDHAWDLISTQSEALRAVALVSLPCTRFVDRPLLLALAALYP